MNTIKMPGFTAEAALYLSERSYLQLQRDARGLPSMANIVPAAKCCERCGLNGHRWCCEECLE